MSEGLKKDANIDKIWTGKIFTTILNSMWGAGKEKYSRAGAHLGILEGRGGFLRRGTQLYTEPKFVKKGQMN